MATPMSAATFAAILRAEGLTVVETPGWATRNRNHKGAWGPVNGVMIHHTVTKGTDTTVRICKDGYAGLPGPLCHGVIAKDGVVHLVGYGRANHAGLGDGAVLQAVVAETAPPRPRDADADGNRHFYGFECENLGDGMDPWPDDQLDAIERAAAAICRHHGWAAPSVIGHKEWQPGKPDPRGFTMTAMRERIDQRLSEPEPEPPTVPPVVMPPIQPKPPPSPPAFPGRDHFGPGTSNAHVTKLGEQLTKKGFGRFYKVGPGPRWGEADRQAVRAFQLSQGRLKGDADGLPGPLTWRILFS